MNEYIVTLHDDADYMTRMVVLAENETKARQDDKVSDLCKRADMHIVSVRLAATPSDRGA